MRLSRVVLLLCLVGLAEVGSARRRGKRPDRNKSRQVEEREEEEAGKPRLSVNVELPGNDQSSSSSSSSDEADDDKKTKKLAQVTEKPVVESKNAPELVYSTGPDSDEGQFQHFHGHYHVFKHVYETDESKNLK